MPEPDVKPWEKFAKAKPSGGGPPSTEGPWTKFGQPSAPKAGAPPTTPPVKAPGVIDKLPLSDVDKEGLRGFSRSFGVEDPKGVGDILSQTKSNLGKAVGQSYMGWLKGLDKETPGGPPKSFLDPFTYINPALATAMTPFDLAASGIEGISKSIQEAGGKTIHGLIHGENKEAASGLGELTGSVLQLGLGKKLSELENTRLGRASSEVHGAVKTAATLGGDPAEATRVAHRASSGWLGRALRNRSIQNQYVDAKGLQVAQQIDKTATAVEKDIEGVAEHINEKLREKGAGSSTVDVSREAQLIKDLYNQSVKTGEPLHPAIREVLAQAKGAKTGLWDFDKARQLRSALGRSLGRISGPQQKVGWQIYNDLSNKLTGVAKKAGLGDEWNHYNNNSRVFHRWYKGIIDDATEATSGEQVGNTLNRHKGETARLLNNLEKFGLDTKDVKEYMDFHQRWKLQSQTMGRGTLFRMAYGHKAGIGTMIAFRQAGTGWLPSMAAGAVAGYTWNELANAFRAAKLSPDVLEHIAKTTSLEKPMKFAKSAAGQAPPEASPSAPLIPTPGGPPPTTPPTTLPDVSKISGEVFPKEKPPTPKEAKAAEAKPSSEAKPYTGSERRVQVGEPPKEGERRKTVYEMSKMKADVEAAKKEELKAKEAAVKDEPKRTTADEALARQRILVDPQKKAAFEAADKRTQGEMIQKEQLAREAEAKTQTPHEKLTASINELSEQIGKVREAGKIGGEEYNRLWELRKQLRKERSQLSRQELESILGKMQTAVRAVADKHYQETIPIQDAMEKAQEALGKVTESEVKKIPEGEHGTGKLARQAKTRERVAAVRKEKGSTALGGGGQEISGGGAAETAREVAESKAAQRRVQTSRMDVNELQIPEMEQFMKEKMPKQWKELKETRRTKGFQEKDYQDALKWYILTGLEDAEETH